MTKPSAKQRLATQIFVLFTPKIGEDEPFLTGAYFSKGLVQPPTRKRVAASDFEFWQFFVASWTLTKNNDDKNMVAWCQTYPHTWHVKEKGIDDFYAKLWLPSCSLFIRVEAETMSIRSLTRWNQERKNTKSPGEIFGVYICFPPIFPRIQKKTPGMRVIWPRSNEKNGRKHWRVSAMMCWSLRLVNWNRAPMMIQYSNRAVSGRGTLPKTNSNFAPENKRKRRFLLETHHFSEVKMLVSGSVIFRSPSQKGRVEDFEVHYFCRQKKTLGIQLDWKKERVLFSGSQLTRSH